VSVLDPLRLTTGDLDVDRALDEVRRSLQSVARDPYINGRDVAVTLPDATAVVVQHGLGRTMVGYSQSPVKGAVTVGMVQETARDARSVTLTATGYGATVTLGLRFW
jgi:hypothetical protein